MMKKLFVSLAAVMTLSLLAVVKADGIYADFSTSMGDFTASLNVSEAPQTVANFIGLAEGSRAWVNGATGAVEQGKPFYDGTTFHRVIAGFMNQAGSPNGLGTDGPGYAFRDETNNGLLHDAPYKLSMANSGPNTNGSQFFITVEPTPWLDGKHTVFGQITSGQTVVDQINGVSTDANDKPQSPVVIHSVAIRRVGVAATAFDIHTQGLPVCRVMGGYLTVQPNVQTTWQTSEPQPAGSIFKVFRSTDMSAWTLLRENYRSPDLPGVHAQSLDDASSARAFYHLSCVTYPDALGPSSLAGRTMTTRLFNESQTLTFLFDESGAAGTGSYVSSGGSTPFSFTLFDAYIRPYSATWIINTNQFGYLRVRCALNSENSSHILGSHSVDQYDFALGSWQALTTGTLTISK